MGRPKKYKTDEERDAAYSEQHTRAAAKWYNERKDDPEFKRQRVQTTLKYHRTQKGKQSKFFAKLKYDFNMEREEYEALLEKQKGLCAICGQPQKVIRVDNHPIVRLAVDHDHETQCNRSLLCALCNRGLGMLRDSPEILRAALAYLAAHGKS